MTSLEPGIAMPGEGIPLSRLAPYVKGLRKFFIKDFEMINPEAALPTGERPLVFIAAHGPLYAPTPMILLLGEYFIDHGLSDKVVGIYPHPMLMRFPGMKALFSRLGTPTRVYDLEGLVARLKDGRINITGTGPEGMYCHLSWTDYVGPFDNAGMIAAAVLADADICLLAHQGGDAWNLRLNLPFGLTVPLTRGLRGINVPIGPVRRVERMVVSCERYSPGVSRKALEKADGREKRLLITLEVEKIRHRLNSMTDVLMRSR